MSGVKHKGVDAIKQLKAFFKRDAATLNLLAVVENYVAHLRNRSAIAKRSSGTDTAKFEASYARTQELEAARRGDHKIIDDLRNQLLSARSKLSLVESQITALEKSTGVRETVPIPKDEAALHANNHYLRLVKLAVRRASGGIHAGITMEQSEGARKAAYCRSAGNNKNKIKSVVEYNSAVIYPGFILDNFSLCEDLGLFVAAITLAGMPLKILSGPTLADHLTDEEWELFRELIDLFPSKESAVFRLALKQPNNSRNTMFKGPLPR